MNHQRKWMQKKYEYIDNSYKIVEEEERKKYVDDKIVVESFCC